MNAVFDLGTTLRERIAGLFAKGAKAKGDAVPVRDWVNVGGNASARWLGFDASLVWVTAGLIALGLVMVYSASVAMPDNPKFSRYAPTYFLTRHLLFIAISFVAALATVQIPLRVWEKCAPWLFVAALLMLVIVLIPHVGKVVYGARRWIPLGIMNFQPSELASSASRCTRRATWCARWT